MASPVDLRQLAVERAATGAAPRPHKRAWLVPWGIPLAIVAGFLGIVGWSARDHLLPASPVTVVPVLLTRAEVQQSGTPLFQAAGWIEPRPTPSSCAALAEGVVEELLVVEGQKVAVGEPVAKLLDTDAQLSLREAEATLQLREAEQTAAQAVLTAARTNLDQPVQLQAAHAEAEAALATLETEIKNLPFQIQVAEAQLTAARQSLAGKTSVADAIAGRLLERAQSEFDAASASLAELKQRGPNLAAQQAAWQRKCEALHTQLKLKTAETRALDEATANLAASRARLSQARLAVETAKLRLERMIVRSPIQGRVLALNAHPGRRLMGINATSERDSSTVVTLYDPQQLQVRADVRLEDVPQVQVGQPVQIATAAAKEPLTGRVLAMTSQADIQKNTLQVKVSIDNPLAVIRPEMLAQVTFLAPEIPGDKSDGEQDPLRMLVPKELVDSSDGKSSVWIVDAARGVARRQAVQIGRASTDKLVEVTEGLNPLDKLIVAGRESLADGTRVRVTGNDRNLGANSAGGQASMPVETAASNGPLTK